MNIYRHGDISFHPIKKTSGKKLKKVEKITLASGVSTGHNHVLTCSKMNVFDVGDSLYIIEIKAKAKLTHEEHNTLELAQGIYQMKREQEFDWFSKTAVRVLD